MSNFGFNWDSYLGDIQQKVVAKEYRLKAVTKKKQKISVTMWQQYTGLLCRLIKTLKDKHIEVLSEKRRLSGRVHDLEVELSNKSSLAERAVKVKNDMEERALIAERNYREQQKVNRELILEIERTRCPKLAEILEKEGA
jgi:hypothetical protein